MKTISPNAKNVFVRQRQAARSDSSAVVHSFDPSEPHNTSGQEIPHEGICWCQPEVEDFSSEGGGILIIHKSQVWQ